MFIRRIFYDKQTGEVLYAYMMQGDIKQMPVANDFAVQPALSGHSEDDTACLEWLEPDPDIELLFERVATEGGSYSIESGQLVFDFTPIEEPTEP